MWNFYIKHLSNTLRHQNIINLWKSQQLIYNGLNTYLDNVSICLCDKPQLTNSWKCWEMTVKLHDWKHPGKTPPSHVCNVARVARKDDTSASTLWQQDPKVPGHPEPRLHSRPTLVLPDWSMEVSYQHFSLSQHISLSLQSISRTQYSQHTFPSFPGID